MLKDAAWNIFYNTGSVEAYLLGKELERAENAERVTKRFMDFPESLTWKEAAFSEPIGPIETGINDTKTKNSEIKNGSIKDAAGTSLP